MVHRSAATWHCDGFISLHPCNDDGSCYGALEIVGVIIIIIKSDIDEHCFLLNVTLCPAVNVYMEQVHNIIIYLVNIGTNAVCLTNVQPYYLRDFVARSAEST